MQQAIGRSSALFPVPSLKVSGCPLPAGSAGRPVASSFERFDEIEKTARWKNPAGPDLLGVRQRNSRRNPARKETQE
jgi:hypothetical protein